MGNVINDIRGVKAAALELLLTQPIDSMGRSPAADRAYESAVGLMKGSMTGKLPGGQKIWRSAGTYIDRAKDAYDLVAERDSFTRRRIGEKVMILVANYETPYAAIVPPILTDGYAAVVCDGQINVPEQIERVSDIVSRIFMVSPPTILGRIALVD